MADGTDQAVRAFWHCGEILFASTCFYLLEGILIKYQWTGFTGHNLPKVYAQGLKRMIMPGIYKRRDKRQQPLFVSENGCCLALLKCKYKSVGCEEKRCDTPIDECTVPEQDPCSSDSDSSSCTPSRSHRHRRPVKIRAKHACSRCGFKRCRCMKKIRV